METSLFKFRYLACPVNCTKYTVDGKVGYLMVTMYDYIFQRFSIAVTPIVACYTEELDLASLNLNRHEVSSLCSSAGLIISEQMHSKCTVFIRGLLYSTVSMQ